ncbi:MAG: FAD-dependent monooxygenase [Oceanospirillaceae bacterium]|nr:FAD-dependent monooxygenase [Oceanospirillaceae bacterium]
MDASRARKILVLGAGPAGGAVALGLRRLGYSVCVVSEPRPFSAVEGISERVVEGLRNAGFEAALKTLPAPTPRRVHWNGVTSAANAERLVIRTEFDQGILVDLERNGVELVQGRICGSSRGDDGYRVDVETTDGARTLHAGFLVEARGRAAPGTGLERLRGPETLSLLQYWSGPAITPRTAVQSCADGWAWMAATADGRRYLQLTVDVASAGLPPKEQLVEHCNSRLRALEMAAPFIDGAEPTGELHARTSTPILCREPVGDDWIRVGDAAMAVDPLSGNGIFQSLSSAMQAPAVINTLLQQPQRARLARAFHKARIEELFFRFARIGRDFYAQEAAFASEPFWQRRRDWPDQIPMHRTVKPQDVSIARRPVVENDLIRDAEVVVTPDQPLGVWHLQGLPLAPLLRALRNGTPGDHPEHLLAAALGDKKALAPQLLTWIRRQGWI